MMKHIIAITGLFLVIAPIALGQVRDATPRKDVAVAAAVAPAWPNQRATVGEVEVQVTVTLDGYFGNVIEAESKGPKSAFSDAAERAARLWKFFPSKHNTKLTLTFVFSAFPKNDGTQMAATTFKPPYKVRITRAED